MRAMGHFFLTLRNSSLPPRFWRYWVIWVDALKKLPLRSNKYWLISSNFWSDLIIGDVDNLFRFNLNLLSFMSHRKLVLIRMTIRDILWFPYFTLTIFLPSESRRESENKIVFLMIIAWHFPTFNEIYDLTRRLWLRIWCHSLIVIKFVILSACRCSLHHRHVTNFWSVILQCICSLFAVIIGTQYCKFTF